MTQPPVASVVAGLPAAQREAVLAEDPVVCLLAGAGAGKTRVLTLRVARRIADRSAHPNHVLVCTFSRKAADELRDRLWSLGVGADVQAGTFHRTALRLIGQHRAERGQAPPVVAADRRSLLATVVDGAARARARSGREVWRLDAEIAWAKARGVTPADFEAAARRAGRRPAGGVARVADVYERYEQLRRRRGLLDLDDLLGHCAELLEADRGFARAVRWYHRHLHVDEMQDLNDAQFRLLRLLAGDDPDLFVVGDPNQSVYGWNGADPELLARIPLEFPGTRVLRLDANHRSSPQVVRVASAVLDDPDHAAVSTRRDGPLPRVVRLDTDADEAAWVARQVWRAHRPGRRWSSIAVLARTNAQLTLVAEAMAAEHVPSRTAGADLAPASDVAPGSDAGDQDDKGGTATAGLHVAKSGNIDGHPGTDGHAGDGTSGGDAAGEGAAGEGAEDGTGGDAVVLSTFHRAKGLQWSTVFVIGLSDGLVPLVSARNEQARQEERRLLYVALTRAEDELVCSWATHPDRQRALAGEDARRPCPWLAGVERAVADMARTDVDTDPTQASEHLARIRALLEPTANGAPR